MNEQYKVINKDIQYFSGHLFVASFETLINFSFTYFEFEEDNF